MASAIDPNTAYSPDTQYWETSDYKGNLERYLNATLIVVSGMFLGIRYYVRFVMTKTPGLDDGIAFLAFGALVANSALDIRAADYGSGAHIQLVPPSLLPKFFEAMATLMLMYFLSVGLMRLSIVAFMPRVSKDRNFLILVYIVAAIVIAQTVACFFYKVFECSPVADTWKPPMTPGLNCVSQDSNEKMMNAHAIIGIIVDVGLMALPIHVIYKKMLPSRKMVQVILVFSVGIFVVVTGIIRLYFMKTLVFATNPTYHVATIGLWSDLEGHVGFWCGCFPALQPILRIVSFKLGLRTKPQSTSYGAHTYGLSPSKRSHAASGTGARFKNKGYVRDGSGVDVADAETDGDSQKAIVSVENYEMGKIHKQTETIVRIEKAEPAKTRARNESWVDV